MHTHPIVLFDGVCNYCNSMVNYAIRHDPKGKLRFAPLQSSTASRVRSQLGIPDKIDSVILVVGKKYYTYSDAAVRIARYLSFPAGIARVLWLVPKFIRQPIYKWVARNRYNWFGKKESCMVPSAEVRERFLG
ncbi:MAG: DUF393 domain-containing protein [Chitinophagaceae bacterium]|nr:MAG: DUF393 domain-containing protein [Chitinophagaceae bacterium]